MFAEHQPPIAFEGRSSVPRFTQVCSFVLATIRCKLPTACAATLTLKRTGKLEPEAFFGPKITGIDWLAEHSAELLAEVEFIDRTETGREREIQLLIAFCQIPGIGLAKAGFLAQLLFGTSGCIDTHNLNRFGYGEREFRLDKSATRRTQRKKAMRYSNVVKKCGGTAGLWDGWCEYVSTQRLGYGSAEEVSAMHLAAIGD